MTVLVRSHRLWVCIVCLCLIFPPNMSSGYGHVRRHSTPNKLSFTNSVSQTLEIIAKADFSKLEPLVSSQGITVASVEKIWPDDGRFSKQKVNSANSPLRLNEPDTEHWEVQEKTFAKKQLHDRSFIKLFHSFQSIIRQSCKNYPSAVQHSLNLPDYHSHSHLGPALSGKVCAGELWYVCFTNEGGCWKVWKLEYTAR